MIEIPVSERALIQRFNRTAKVSGIQLKVNRWGSPAQKQIGRWMAVDENGQVFYGLKTKEDFIDLMREQEFIRPNESMVEEG